jgi:hypothetical protein
VCRAKPIIPPQGGSSSAKVDRTIQNLRGDGDAQDHREGAGSAWAKADTTKDNLDRAIH